VAVGATDGYRSDAAVWTSTDGVTWTRVESDSFAGVANEVGNDEDQFMTDVVAVPAGIVAVGADGAVSMFVSSNPPLPNGNAAVWVSADGTTWARTSETTLESDGYQVMQGVAAGPGGLVAVGSTVTDPGAGGLGRAAAWTSDDGLTWTPVPDADLPQPPPPDEPGIPASAGMTDVVWWSDRFVAVGATLPEWGFSDYSKPAIWTSPDGRSWDLVHVGDRGWIDTLATTRNGVLALGNRWGDAPTPLAWISVDGSTWQRVDTALFETVDPDDAHWATFVTATSEGYLAIGHTAGSRASNYYSLAAPHKATPEIWGSTDGVTWHLIAELGQVSRVPAVTDAVRTVMGEVLVLGDVAIAVGSDGVYQSQEAEGLHNFCRVVYSGWCRTDAAVWIGTFDS
ncbi:MAG TPA: hypothetical protein VLD62_07995, partial [Acidimicrobiia bacterium]|nr:hypothetical protein [Acidimicrobiia bacterium]